MGVATLREIDSEPQVSPPPAVVQAYHLPFKNKRWFSGWLRAERDNIWQAEQEVPSKAWV